MKREYSKATVAIERTSKRKKHLDRLTRDAIAALEAGMTYGQYKALHPHTPDEDDEKKELEVDPDSVVATCEYCGEQFVKPKWKTAKRFCCVTCQNRYNAHKQEKIRKQEQNGRTAICVICGATFTVDHACRKYCSTECYAEGQRKRNQERRQRIKEQQEKEAAENGRI